jgi:hypothetical protein
MGLFFQNCIGYALQHGIVLIKLFDIIKCNRYANH